MTGGYAQYLDPYQQAMLAYGGGNLAAQPQAATMPGPPGQPGTRGLGPDGQPNASKSGVNSWGSLLGNIGGVVGLGIPGIGGMALGPAANLAGSWIDAREANRGLAQQGLPTNVTAGPAALSNGMFGLLGALGLGNSIAGQVGDVKTEAAQNDPRFAGPAPGPAPGNVWGGIFGDAFGTSKDYGDFSGGTGGTSAASADGGSKADPGKDGGSWGGGTGGTSGWYAKGGKVRPPQPGARNPPGPDDQMAAVQTGEGVISRPAMKAGWGEMLNMINSDQGGALAQLLRGLLK